MALATQCPHCHTTFRVAHDQLKLRAGLVRCGSCQQIFNGIENLLRLEESAPVSSPPLPISEDRITSPAGSSDTATAEPPSPAEDQDQEVDFYLPPDESDPPEHPVLEQPDTKPEETAAEPTDADEDDKLEAGGEDKEGQTQDEDQAPAAPHISTPEDSPLPDAGTQDTADAVVAFPLSPDDSAEDAPPQPSRNVDHDPLGFAQDDRNDEEDADDEPSFVRQGRRRQRLGRTVRAVMLTCSVLLLLGLLGQAAYVFRDQLAARLPQVKPLLLQACAYLDCQVGLPATIDALTVESSELTLGPGSATLVLTVLLRNESTVAQTWPHLELTLNDASEKPLVRRVFAPAEYLPPDISPRLGFPAHSEQPVRLFLELEGTEASGYRVYLFHP